MTSLTDFLPTTELGRLTPAQRRLIVEQALLVLEQNYALLPFKVARYGINPLQRLRLLQQRLGRDGDPELEWRMHRELLDVFNSLRDLHTRYTLPVPFNGVAVFLPFLLKEFTEDGRRRYLVSRRQAGQPELDDPSFRFGVEVTHWNGVPIARAIERFGEGLPGANADARHARAVQMFTVRSLAFAAPPDEEWITLGYRDAGDQPRETRMTWSATPIETATGSTADTPLGVDVEGAQLARLRAELFAPAALAGRPAADSPEVVPVEPELTTVFEARRVAVGGRTIGHLRIRTFMPTASGIVGFVREFARLLTALPPDGLVLDVRGNGGGAVVAAELCLQALTARPVEPEPAQFAVTALNLRLCRTNDSLRPWLKSMDQSLECGAPYTAGIPFTEREWLEAVPQSYSGPIVLLTDARCYSATDIFAAGFQDNGIGRVLGADGNTGAGGGNVWQLGDLIGALAGQNDSPFRALPLGAGLSLVIRRMLRVGANAGTPLEDYGVVPDEVHHSTRRDILEDDADLMAAAAELLEKSPPRRFDVTLSEAGGSITAVLTVLGADRADFEVDGRPRYSADLNGPGPIEVANCGGARLVRVRGYDKGDLVALRTFTRRGETLQPLETLAD
ncbi:S41 family peptidase [Actinoplanes sp. Pm04-4]|uniref:S41 family peptidase n=1 Tax=Paractinoplanes pyxinae TaxID=2997416 RepID=A0ABT4AVK0_9ACTN|nr:S41 family peptidase [Actinoplanes pyxinae]MCY1138279.1 S41 family peptidase [Actinoplanes pyxinae]